MHWKFKCARFFFVEFDVHQKMSINRTDWFSFECYPEFGTTFVGPGIAANLRDSDRLCWGLRLVMSHNLSGFDVRSSLQHGAKSRQPRMSLCTRSPVLVAPYLRISLAR